MCWNCGGRCRFCGEPSTKVIEGRIEDELQIEIFACGEHITEAQAMVDTGLDHLVAAPWN